MELFNNIEPDDVKQGNVDNCYIMATFSGMAERDLEADTEGKISGKTIRELFLTQEINKAGCYAMKFVLDGEQQTVVVDDYLPMKRNKKGELYFAFCKGGKGQREIWMCLLEKAFAKICGSYENTANIRAKECMLFLTGGPTMTYDVSSFHMDIRRGKQLEHERFDKFYQLIQEATKKQWIITGSTPDFPDDLKNKDEETLKWATINNQGIKYNHCYTILDVRQVNLEKKHQRRKETYTDIIALFRNPSGKSSRGGQWYGDWCKDDDLWSKETKKQLGDAYRVMNESKFWMSLEDMFKQFSTFTINQCNMTFQRRVVEADIITQDLLNSRKEAGKGIPSSFFGTSWAVFQVRFRHHQPHCFFRLWQLNHMLLPREFDSAGKLVPFKFKEYPELTLIVAKKSRVPPKHTNKSTAKVKAQLVYLNGDIDRASNVGVRVDNIRPGDYYVVYKHNYPSDYPYHKLNLVLNGQVDLVTEAQIRRIPVKTFKSQFFSYLLECQKKRDTMLHYY